MVSTDDVPQQGLPNVAPSNIYGLNKQGQDKFHGTSPVAGRWLATNGASHLTLLSRSGRQEGEVAPLEDLLHPGWGASVTMCKCNVASREDAEGILGHDRSHGAVFL